MLILLSGGCKNGKSAEAQAIVCELAKKACVAPIYFATMIPHDSEDDERIKKHRDDRKKLGFETIECGKNIGDAANNLRKNSVVLFDSLTALVANEMFDGRTNLNSLFGEEEKIIQKLCSDLMLLIEKSSAVVFVSDGIFCDGIVYDKMSELYRRILAKTENFIAKKCDKVIEMVSKISNVQSSMEFENNSTLIIGGAYQGKTAWAKENFSLSDEDIFICTQEELPDFSKRCISHYENYVAYCLKNEISPKTDLLDSKDKKIIICDDIFCGIVPIDSFQRKLREETGIALQKIASAENISVIRVFCGVGQKLQ